MTWTVKDSLITLSFMIGILASSAMNGLTKESLLPDMVRWPLLFVSLIGMCWYPLRKSRRWFSVHEKGRSEEP